MKTDTRNLLLLGAALGGVFLLAQRGGGPAGSNLVPVPQSATRDSRGDPWPIGKLVTTPDGRPGIVVAG